MARFKLREIAEKSAEDPKQAILDSVGDFSDHVNVHANWVLVAQYIAPEKTPGGIIRPDRNLQEDHFQGKVGLVLKLGPDAFSDGVVKFGAKAKLHDWVIFSPGDTWQMTGLDTKGHGTPLRWIRDQDIKGTTDDPSIIW